MSTTPSRPSLIAGVGASAGGLSAFESFLKGLKTTEEIGCVLVQHLDPHHESELPGILQRVTPAVVHPVADGMQVEGGHVYVIPAGKHLRIEEGKLFLADPENGPSVRSPVDSFLRSLAQDQQEKAACIILSGTGTDGTLGLKAIKEHGGICLVQDPADAEYGGMPESAIASELVDVVAPAGALGDRLSSYLNVEPQLPDQGEEGAQVEENTHDEREVLPEIFTLLNQETGLDFSAYKPTTIWRRIGHRMQILQIPEISAYVNRLRSSPDECDTLAREFLISVTNFFRDPEAFEQLAQRAIPRLFADTTDADTIRVWVPGCATGEEAYSLLMLLLEHRSTLQHSPAIQIFATDIDERALAHARTGFYPTTIANDVSEARLQQFFVHEDGGYRVRPELRESILFAEHNLLTDPPFSGLDLISCRNVLIYLTPETQKKVLTLFHYALDPQKFLFLGRSETPEVHKGLFASVEEVRHLYRAKQRKTDYPFPLVSGSHPGPSPHKRRRSGRGAPSTVQMLHRRLVTERYVPPSVLVNEEFQLVHMIGDVGQYLEVQPGLPSTQLVDVVPGALRMELRAALFNVFHQGESAVIRIPADQWDADGTGIQMTVEPANGTGQPDDGSDDAFALVTFGDTPPSEEGQPPPVNIDASDPDVARLQEELERTQHRLEVVTEEYETSNEELLASNEELQSTNEELRSTMQELQTSREELQSTNEELVTVNQELKAKIEALNQRNSDVQNLMEATDVGTLFLNTDLELRRYTARATDLFNIIPSDVGRPFAHLSHTFGYDGLDDDAVAVLEQLEPVEREVQQETGEWYKLRVLPYRTVEDTVDGVLMTFFEITELKEAQRRIQEINEELEQRVTERTNELEAANEELQSEIEERERARKHFQKLFRLGPVAGLISTLDEGRIQDVNQRFLKLTGYTRDELIGETILSLGMVNEHRHRHRSRVLAKEQKVRNEELTLRSKEGEPIEMMFSKEVIDLEGVPSVLSLGVNITARKEAEEALRKAKEEAEAMNELKTSFIANMSHEIRTPLTGIIGFADILEERISDTESQKHLHYIQANGRRLLETLDSVLDLARLDAEQITLDPAPIELQAFAEETLALFAVRAENKEVELGLHVSEGLGRVRLDESALQRILNNLLGNALKFTEEGYVTVSFDAEKGHRSETGAPVLRIEVRDTGIGMEEAFLDTLFDEFAQEETGLTRSHEGAGLGLAITHRLVSLMDGTVAVESEKGKGTTFVVRLPYRPMEEAEPSNGRIPNAEQGGLPPIHRVLVVDDRPEVGIIVERFLSGCEVVTAESSEEALTVVQKHSGFDLALVDIHLGNQTSGLELLPQLRARFEEDPSGAIPILAMTAHSLPGDRQRFLDKGFDGYVGKPFTRTGIQTKVQDAFRAQT